MGWILFSISISFLILVSVWRKWKLAPIPKTIDSQPNTQSALSSSGKRNENNDPFSISKSEKLPDVAEIMIYFGGGISTLERTEMDKLRGFLKKFDNSRIQKLQIYGSADVSGNKARNRKLVKERVQAVHKIVKNTLGSKIHIEHFHLEPQYGKSARERERFRSVKLRAIPLL